MLHLSPSVEPSGCATLRRRPRVGLIVPRSNTTCEGELQDFADGRFSLHTARMKTVAGSLASDPQQVALQALEEPVRDLELCRTDIVALGCTTAAMACEQDRLTAALRFDERARPVLISQSIVRVLGEAGAQRVALFTPYTSQSNAAMAAFLEPAGFEVTVALGLDLNTSPDRFALVSDLTSDYLLKEIAAMDIGNADCLLISCTDLHTRDILAEVAAMKGVPTFSSNQAFFDDIEREVRALSSAVEEALSGPSLGS